MKKGQIYTGTVEKMEFPNRGIVTADGEKAIVKNALPGQKVRFVINKKRNGRCEGRLLEVEEPSPLETVSDPCPHFGVCGGCLMQTIPYSEQLKIKEQQVRTLLDQVCPDCIFEGIKPSPQWEGYRNKMEFSFGDETKGGPLCLGLHKRGSFHDIVNTDHCRIVHPDFTRILTLTRRYFADREIPFYRKLQHEGYLRHLLVRRAVKTGEILAALVTSGQTEHIPSEKQLLEEWCSELIRLPMEGAFAGILHIRNDSLADVVRSEERRNREQAAGLAAQRTQNQTFITDIDGQKISSLELVNCLPNGKIQTVNSMKFHSRTIKATLGIDFKYHHLRHTYGTRLAEMNTPTHILCNQMGHASGKVTERYYLAVSKSGIDILTANLNAM